MYLYVCVHSYQRRLRGNFGFIVRVVELGLQVQAEIGVVFHLLVAQFEHESTAPTNNSAHHHWIQHCIDIFAQILDEDGLTVLDRELNKVDVSVLSLLDHLHVA